jgi:Arc/MetJ-type ribon-helix-helix transcriptional regulator
MATMNISLPIELLVWTREYALSAGYTGASELVRELLRAERDRVSLRELLMDAAVDPDGRSPADLLLDEVDARIARQRGG